MNAALMLLLWRMGQPPPSLAKYPTAGTLTIGGLRGQLDLGGIDGTLSIGGMNGELSLSGIDGNLIIGGMTARVRRRL